MIIYAALIYVAVAFTVMTISCYLDPVSNGDFSSKMTIGVLWPVILPVVLFVALVWLVTRPMALANNAGLIRQAKRKKGD